MFLLWFIEIQPIYEAYMYVYKGVENGQCECEYMIITIWLFIILLIFIPIRGHRWLLLLDTV